MADIWITTAVAIAVVCGIIGVVLLVLGIIGELLLQAKEQEEMRRPRTPGDYKARPRDEQVW